MIRQRTDDWEISFQLSWQRLLALLLALAGVVVLGFGLIRPTLSAYLGREVSRQMNAEVAREVVVILSGEVIAPERPAPAAPAGAPAAGAPATQAAGSGAAPDTATSAGQGSAPAIAASAGQGSAPVAPSIPGGQAPVDSASILRAVAERPAQAERPEPAAAEQPAVGAPAAEQPAVEAPGAAPNAPPVGTAPNTPAEPRSAEEIVAALPSGTLTISEAKVNARIAERAAALGPIENLAVRFLPGQVQVQIDVLGQQSIGTAELTVTEGRVVAQNPALSGPLSLFISAVDLVKPIEDELNAILAAAEREVTGVQVSEGELVVTLK